MNSGNKIYINFMKYYLRNLTQFLEEIYASGCFMKFSSFSNSLMTFLNRDREIENVFVCLRQNLHSSCLLIPHLGEDKQLAILR